MTSSSHCNHSPSLFLCLSLTGRECAGVVGWRHLKLINRFIISFIARIAYCCKDRIYLNCKFYANNRVIKAHIQTFNFNTRKTRVNKIHQENEFLHFFNCYWDVKKFKTSQTRTQVIIVTDNFSIYLCISKLRSFSKIIFLNVLFVIFHHWPGFINTVNDSSSIFFGELALKIN